jgi:acetate kinase
MAVVVSGNSACILVLNAGSNNLKLALFAASGEERLVEDSLEWSEDAANGHAGALRRLIGKIEPSRIRAVGHRVVHGGEQYREAVRIDDKVKRSIADLISLAPLHNPAALAVIEAAEQLLPAVPQVAVFDTAFHATLSPAQFIYPLPYRWYEEWGIRRFGFHGLSHAYCAGRVLELLGTNEKESKIVVCHLGAGCSLAAVAGGRSVATTMGFTPLDGVPMATRPGALDPGILTHLLRTGLLSLDDLDAALRHDAGLKGLSGISGDMRDILTARAEGHERSVLAFDVFTNRVREGIASMAAAMGGIDAIVFTAGIGEHAPEVRTAVCAGLTWMGVVLDEEINAVASPDQDIARHASPVRVLLFHTREDLVIARETRRLL